MHTLRGHEAADGEGIHCGVPSSGEEAGSEAEKHLRGHSQGNGALEMNWKQWYEDKVIHWIGEFDRMEKAGMHTASEVALDMAIYYARRRERG